MLTKVSMKRNIRSSIKDNEGFWRKEGKEN